MTITWYYDRDISRWERLEKSGRIGPGQLHKLNEWRRLKAKVPSMTSMEVHGRDRCMVGKADWDEAKGQWAS